MFMSTRNQGSSRRTRVYGNKKAAASRVSLFSRLTSNSTGSNGSTSTVTQESFDRSRRSSKARSSEKVKKTKRVRRPSMQPKNKASESSNSLYDKIDVFAFLEKDQSRTSLVGSVKQVERRSPLRHITTIYQDESDQETTSKSPHSDSGISLDDSVGDMSRSLTYPRTRLQPLLEDDAIHLGLRRESRQGTTFIGHHPARWGDYPITPPLECDDVKDSYRLNVTETDVAPDFQPFPGAIDLNGSAEPQGLGQRGPRSESGYDLLSSKLSQGGDESPLPPLYRRFSKLNHRILLQLQDEIAEMEEELDRLDRADARVRLQTDGHSLPASRRMDWRLRDSELYARRLELLGRVHTKMEQYNQALVSRQNVMRETTSASPSDLSRYRSWLEQHHPLSAQEMRFLEDASDLITLQHCSTSAARVSHRAHSLHGMPVCIFLSSWLTLLFFRLVNNLLTRLIFLVSTLGAAAVVKDRQGTASLWAHQECSVVYVVVMASVAILC